MPNHQPELFYQPFTIDDVTHKPLAELRPEWVPHHLCWNDLSGKGHWESELQSTPDFAASAMWEQSLNAAARAVLFGEYHMEAEAVLQAPDDPTRHLAVMRLHLAMERGDA